MRLGTMELIVILVVVLLIFGPKQLPKLAKMVGNGVGSLKKHVNAQPDWEEEKVEEKKTVEEKKETVIIDAEEKKEETQKA
ncbi:MAG: twin-arginine translocase TatA/TatE family subunit [Clostridiales bacterium]|nr:twin-arginine translocase TatA/TatE family subunit [Clostridiales bacterium]